jgi:superfamily II DNA or RNA helicase
MSRILLLTGTSLAKALAAGERWITVHPHGQDEKGQPVLIQEQKDGTAKVIGGAGGKLNHLRLTGVRPQGSYAEKLKERDDIRKAAVKRQREIDKQLGLQKSKAEAHAKVRAQKAEARRKFVEGVAQAMGWTPEETTFDEAKAEGLETPVANRLREYHLADLVKRAREAVNLNRERLLTDASARAEVDLGEVPLATTDPAKLSVADIDPVSVIAPGLGFATDYKGRAQRAGADVKAEAAESRKELTDAQRQAQANAGEIAEKVREALEELRDPDQDIGLKPKLVDAKTTLELLKLDKKRRLAEREAAKARKDIAESREEPKAYVIEAADAEIDGKVAQEVEADLRTISTRAFLSEVAKRSDNPMKELGRYVGAGAYNSVNSLALAAGGAALVDRSVVDVLGIAGAAQVLARRLQADLPDEEYQNVVDGFGEFHLSHYMQATEEALARSHELEELAAEIQLGEAENGHDLAALQEINQRRQSALAEANKTLGTALGEMEANAALVYALGRGREDKSLEVPLGELSMESAIAQVRAIGLKRGDYVIERHGAERMLKVTPEGLDRLADPVNLEDLRQVRRNLDIIRGGADQQDWMPEGIIDRADLDHNPEPGVAPQLASPFEPGEDLEASVKDYIGGRMADGDAPGEIVADLQSLPFAQKVGAASAASGILQHDRQADYRAILDRVAPLSGEDGQMRQAESLRESFEAMADDFVQSRYGQARTPLHRQAFDAEGTGVEALHRALAKHPEGVAAYKPVGELTPQDQGSLREVFHRRVARETPEAAATRRQLEGLEAAEPEKTVEDMFGEAMTNPEWSAWRDQRDQLRETVAAGSTTWPKYVASMRSPERAYAAVQDLVRSDVNKSFADTYNRLKPDAPLKLGRAVIRENLNHLDAVDPAAREARMAKEASLRDSLRNRAQGRYAGGAVSDKLDAAREDEAGLAAAQMGLFGGEESAPDRDAEPLAADERHYLGHVAERQIASLMPKVGANFQAGRRVGLFRPVMSGGKNWARQRAVKLIEANKRAILSFGTGAGKTLIGLGAYTQLQSKGKVKRGLFAVPSISQGGFAGEALRFIDPKKGYRWHAQPGADRASRIAAYKDPENHFSVVTHDALRDDLVHLGAQKDGVSEDQLVEKLRGMDREGRKAWMGELLKHEGIDVQYLNVDEGHDLLDRKGKETSIKAMVIDAISDNVPYYVNASADPVKNDVSEAFSLLQKMDPARYTDRAAFMRKYGVDTPTSKDALRRELARFQYPSKIDPDVTANRIERKVEISDAQKAQLAAVNDHLAKARIARMQGKVDVEAAKALSPASFEGAPEAEHEAIAAEIVKNLGLVKSAAMRRALEGSAEGADIEAVADEAAKRPGRQGLVFAHSLASVEAIRRRLGNEHRIITITGKDSAKDKAAKVQAYKEGEADIVVASDAGAVGANLQSGSWLVNFDTPDTAKTHAQRNGRINRTGQERDVDLIDLVRDHPDEARRRERLRKKYALRDAMTTPMEGLDDTGVAYFLRRRSVARENGGLL